jgi:hypothetical protein
MIVQGNNEKYNKNLREYVDIFLFQLVLIFPLTKLDVSLDSLTLCCKTVFNIKHKLCMASVSVHLTEYFYASMNIWNMENAHSPTTMALSFT